MFKIGDFSKLTQVSVRMLRYYDELGLLKPAEVDKFTGYRFYSAKQISRLNKIVTLRDMGFISAEIIAILEEHINDANFIARLEAKKQELAKTIVSANEKLQKLDHMINSIGMERVNMSYEVTLKSVPSYKVVSLREIIPAYNQEGLLWEKLGFFAEKEKIPCSSPFFAMYHDPDYKEVDVDVETAMCVSTLLEDKDGFTFRETESVPCMAAMMITGPFENLAPAYNALAEWVEQNGYEVTGTSRQICHSGPWNESSPDNYLTEIQIPVAKK